MKLISVFNHYLERGGEAVAVEAICKALSHLYEIEKCEFFSADWIAPSAPPRWKQAFYTIYNFRSVNELRHLQERVLADCWLIHNVFPVGSLGIYSCAKRRRIPVIHYIHNFRPFSVTGYLWAGDQIAPGGLSKNYWEEVRHAAWQHSHAKTAWLAFVLTLGHALNAWKGITWIAISEFMREKFIAAGIPRADIFTLRHFWVPKCKEKQQRTFRHYLYMGRLDVPKGVLVLIEAWEILEKECGTAAPRLIIAGSGPLRAKIEQHVAKLHSVEFVGVLSGTAKMRALEECKAVIVPSIWWEPLGLTVYEAYDYSRPVLASRSGALPETVIDGQTGFLHEPGNAGQLASHVLKMEKHPELILALGQRGRLWLEQNADEKEWQKGFSRVLNHALQKAKA